MVIDNVFWPNDQMVPTAGLDTTLHPCEKASLHLFVHDRAKLQ
jgi:hypothetical protein